MRRRMKQKKYRILMVVGIAVMVLMPFAPCRADWEWDDWEGSSPSPPSDDGYGFDWLSGLAFGWTYQIITYVLGDDDMSSDSMRVVVEESSGNVAAQ